MRRRGWLCGIVAAATAGLSLHLGCGSSDGNAFATGTGDSGSTASGAGPSGSGGGLELSTSGAGGAGGIEACAAQEAEATLKTAPVDIIFVIDNSASMTESIQKVQANINQNFAQIIEASGLDYRVIMLSKHGKANLGQSICVEAPLSGIAAGGCAAPPSKPVNGAKFFHYSVEISSTNSWCQIFKTFAKQDEHNLAPMGWKEWLRPKAFKLFVEMTDDRVSCTTTDNAFNDKGTDLPAAQTEADEFDAALLALDPAHFGTAAARNYRWYSIVALANKDANNPALPWLPNDPMTAKKCGSNPAPGVGYQALSIKTEGLRFPLCAVDHYDAIFNEIAKGVISGAALQCNFDVPLPPDGQLIDLSSIEVNYTPSDGGATKKFSQVASKDQCAADLFYLENEQIVLCEQTCDAVSSDLGGKIKVLFACAGIRN